MSGTRWVTDLMNADTPQGARERRRLYREFCAVIALNDDPGAEEATQVRHVESMVSVTLVAFVFDKSPGQVAQAVIRIRRNQK